MKVFTKVSIIIPSFNCKSNLFRLLDSLKKTTYPKYKIIVVDNGSKDGTFKFGKKAYPDVKWIDAGEINIGQTGCYNLGFSYADENDHLLMVDSDVVIDKDMVKYLVLRLESKKNIGITTPMVLYLEDRNWVNQAGSNVDLLTGKVTVGWGPKKDFLDAKKVQGSGTVMLFKNKLVQKIGGFEDWFLCYFDPEYCLRAKKVGYECWYEPSAVCYHDQSKDPNIWRPRVLNRAYLLGRNRTLFMRKHGNIYIYSLFLPILLGYYFIEALKYNLLIKWLELLRGSIAGFFYLLSSKNKVKLSVHKNIVSS